MYTVTFLGTLPAGKATDINSYGQVVGYVAPSGANFDAFLWTPTVSNGTTGSMTDIGQAIGSSTANLAFGINSKGQVTGRINAIPAGLGVGFLWTPNTPNGTTGSAINTGNLPSQTIDTEPAKINSSGEIAGADLTTSAGHSALWTPSIPNGTSLSLSDIGELPGNASGIAAGINDSGQVVGSSGDQITTNFGFLWTPTSPNGTSGSMIPLGDLGEGSGTSAGESINNSGKVVGSAKTDTHKTHAFLWTPDQPHGSQGSMLDLGDLPGGIDRSFASDINNSDQVVGDGSVTGTFHAFIWSANQGMLDLNTLLDASGASWVLTAASAINDAGQIVGSGVYNPTGTPNPFGTANAAFLLTPIPEPATASIVLWLTCSVLRRRPNSRVRRGDNAHHSRRRPDHCPRRIDVSHLHARPHDR